MDALYQNDHQFLAIDGASKLKMILPAHSVFRCIISTEGGIGGVLVHYWLFSPIHARTWKWNKGGVGDSSSKSPSPDS
uniref:Uncharacterized protein n=1 Tax=Aegilops tauschii subsp. strangulata TaxID=200361 RepID=A0A452ZK71_AEGTS